MIDLDFDPQAVSLVSLVLRVVMLGASGLMVYVSIRARMPWAMVAGLSAGVMMAVALILSGTRGAGIDLDPGLLRLLTLTLSFMAAITLIAATWTMWHERQTYYDQR